MENKVKQLKDEALAARKELDELKQKEKTFQTEICNIKTLKETQRQQQVALQSSIDKSQADFDKEMNMLQDLLDTLIHSIDNMKARDIQKETETLFAIQLSERNDLFTQLKKKQEELKAVDQQFIDDIRDELRDLTDQNNNDNRTLLDEVANSREGANALIERIKTTASSLLINEER
ncbi:hypothetical protein BDF20DRAFT_865547 [Mycotypha africana]|uniref:uncharacterized protein n=1 Tax=Mycotypha africana TaxID=64632 RepID=UPI0023016E20|nr:uncharacterized protein BDF20DRAFT_865547 [Mycotypha africana]KAI8982199.1 hypothetical protein BDF20DRAFT_865547 [Mycotypha africana]